MNISISLLLVCYIVLLLLLFLGFLTVLAAERIRYRMGERRWASRKALFARVVESYLLQPDDAIPPRIKLRGAFREWAFKQLLMYDAKLEGESRRKLRRLLEDHGFLVEFERWMESRKWWERARGLHACGVFELPDCHSKVLELLEHDKHPFVRRKALFALSRIGDERDLEAMVRAIDSGDYEWYQLEQMVGLLEQLKLPDDGDLPEHPLLGAIRKAERPFTKRCLFECAGRKGVYSAIPLLGSALLQESDSEVRIGILKAIMQLGAVTLLPDLMKLADQEAEPVPVRIVAMKAAAMMSSADQLDFLREQLGDSIWWIRYYSALGLARIGGTTELERLSELHPDSYGREMARYFLQLLSSEGALWRSVERSLAYG